MSQFKVTNSDINRVKSIIKSKAKVVIDEQQATELLEGYYKIFNEKLPLTDKELWNNYSKVDISHYIGYTSADTKYVND